MRDLGTENGESAYGGSGLANSKRLQLDTPPRIRRYLIKLLAKWERGEVLSEDVGRLASALKVLMAMTTGDTVERRVQALEAQYQELSQR